MYLTRPVYLLENIFHYATLLYIMLSQIGFSSLILIHYNHNFEARKLYLFLKCENISLISGYSHKA